MESQSSGSLEPESQYRDALTTLSGVERLILAAVAIAGVVLSIARLTDRMTHNSPILLFFSYRVANIAAWLLDTRMVNSNVAFSGCDDARCVGHR